jgi:hypothetical protein
MKNIFLILSFVFGVIFIQSCKKSSQDDNEEQQPKATVAVLTDRVKTSDVAVTVNATGMTDASRKEKVLAPAAGWIAPLQPAKLWQSFVPKKPKQQLSVQKLSYAVRKQKLKKLKHNMH